MFKYQSNGEAWLWPPHILHRLTGISIYDGLPFKGGKVFLGQASAENLLRKTESLSKVFCLYYRILLLLVDSTFLLLFISSTS